MRLLSRLRGTRSRREAGEAPEGFDPAFYRARYPDLAGLADPELARHYRRSGRAEGRAGHAAELIAGLEARHGALPFDFDPDTYRGLNDDLTLALGEAAWAYTAHFLEHGRPEGRKYSGIDAPLADEFARLLVEEALAGRPGGDAGAGPDALARYLIGHGLTPAPWLKRFKLPDFTLANAAWLPPPVSRSEALRAFVEVGIQRLAPVAMELPFDAVFYRAAYAAADPHPDAELYRHWLARGMGRFEAPSEMAGLLWLTDGDAFPAAFDEAAYRAARPDAPPTCYRALEHYVLTGFPAGVDGVVRGPGAAALFEIIGRWHGEHWRPDVAARAFARAVALGPSPARHHGRGEALTETGDLAGAAEAYEAAADLPDAGLWSFVHGAELRSELGQHQRALDLLARGGSAALPEWRDAAAGAIRGRFSAASEAARDQYRAGRRTEGDALMEGALAAVAGAWAAFGFLPGPLPPAEAGPILILANLDLPQCVHYRVEQRRRQLEHGGWTVEIHDQHAPLPFIEALTGARAAIFYRTAAFPDVVRAILHARALAVSTFYEVDDLIFDPLHYPDPFESFEGQVTADEYAGLLYGVPLFRGAMALCEAGIASTPALADAMRGVVRGGVCHVLRNALDQRNEAGLARPLHAEGTAGGVVTLFYGSGTKAHNADFTELAAPALLAALERHGHVRLVIAGYLALDARFDRYRDRIRQLGFTRDVDAYWEALAAADVNLAVLKPGRAADAKSEIKWLEAAMLGVPSIVSGTRTYREILTDGGDALLADDVAGWDHALDRLIVDPRLRHRIGAAARETARNAYSLDRAVETLAAFLPLPGPEDGAFAVARVRAGAASAAVLAAEGVRPTPRWAPPPLGPVPAPAPRRTLRRPRPKPRVLVVNVFMPPQTIGGATRVVRDNVDYLLDQAADRFDLVLASGDEGAMVPYRTRTDAYRGRPVFRIATPLAENMDWRPTDPAVGGLFDAFLARLAPDLVHVHCVQRLTASVVEAVQARGIPYVVTAHDGWWISDHQFLVDEDGRLRMPSSDPLAAEPTGSIDRLASAARRGRLGRVLAGARAVLAVSETFADLYRASGVAHATAVPNGLPSLPAPLAREPDPRGRVRLGHIGGRSAHKGATLLEAALRATSFRHLALTMVDLAKDHGHRNEETWGTTPVTVIGRLPQEAMPALYGDLDVLVAPSLWPESFGLVSREARAYGLWVIASDRGAMGEGLEPGVNGFLVDVAGSEGLIEALARIDADPERFRAAPPSSPGPVRTADDQAAELVALYDGLIAQGRGDGPVPVPADPSFEDPEVCADVALTGVATQSSRPAWCDVGPEALAGGDLAREFNLHTEADEPSWWQVDFGRRMPLGGIVVHNRREAFREGARSLRVAVSDDGAAWTLVHAGLVHFGSAARGCPLVLPLGGRVWARFVRLSLDERQPLVLARVEILVARAALELLRLRDELALDSPLLAETEAAVEPMSYTLVGAPGTREGPMIGLAIVLNPAIGNGLLQHVIAVLLARRLGLSFIRLATKDISGVVSRSEPETIGGITFLPASHPLPPGGWFLEGYFWELGHFLRVVDGLDPTEVREIVRTIIHPLFNLLPAVFPVKPDDTLVIHIRSGDIFSTWVNAAYVQPPLAYYTLVVDRFVASGKASRVTLVYENRKNPVIDALEAHLAAKGIPCTLQSGSIVEDVGALVNARHLVFGFGTLGPAICYLSGSVETVVSWRYSIDQGFQRIPTIRNLVEVVDEAGAYIKPGEWTNSPAQRQLMIAYPEANLRIEGTIEG